MDLCEMNVARHHRSPIRSRVLAGGLLLAVIGAAAAGPATPAAAVPLSHASPVSAARPGQPARSGPGVVSWSVVPASATAPDSRTIFAYTDIKPGTTIFDHVAVFNRSNQPVAFSVYATDATGTSATGALTLLPTNARPISIGAWTTFPGHIGQLSVIIPGNKGVIEPFTITVPLRATPGDHIGGMIAAVGVPHRTTAGQLVTVYERIAVPMELRVTGQLVAALRVESVSVGFSNPFNPFGTGSAHVTYSVVNTGNVMLTGTQVVTIAGPFGAKSTIRMHALPTVLPGDSVPYTASSGGFYPAGSVTAHVTVTPGWPANATPLPVTLLSTSASGSVFTFPWALLVLVIVLAGGGFGWSRVVRRRRRAHEADIALAAEQARQETERRLLGGSNGKSEAKSALKSDTKSNGKPAAAAKPDAKPTAKPAPKSGVKPAAKPARPPGPPRTRPPGATTTTRIRPATPAGPKDGPGTTLTDPGDAAGTTPTDPPDAVSPPE